MDGAERTGRKVESASFQTYNIMYVASFWLAANAIHG